MGSLIFAMPKSPDPNTLVEIGIIAELHPAPPCPAQGPYIILPLKRSRDTCKWLTRAAVAALYSDAEEEPPTCRAQHDLLE
jgi:hypothetical protein